MKHQIPYLIKLCEPRLRSLWIKWSVDNIDNPIVAVQYQTTKLTMAHADIPVSELEEFIRTKDVQWIDLGGDIGVGWRNG